MASTATPIKQYYTPIHKSNLKSQSFQTPSKLYSNLTQQKNPSKSNQSITTKSSNQLTPSSDRFIPNRNGIDSTILHHRFQSKQSNQNNLIDHRQSPIQSIYKDLSKSLFPNSESNQILTYTTKNASPQSNRSSIRAINTTPLISTIATNSSIKMQKPKRQINKLPEKILDAPDLMDDYYLNLLDWSSNNLIVIGLKNSVYLWNATTEETNHLFSLEEEDQYISSVSWASGGEVLAVGTSEGEIQLWDIENSKKIRSFISHNSRISTMNWTSNVLSTGGRDTVIVNHDVRCHTPEISVYTGHSQEICGLQWNPTGDLLASGGNDNLLLVWDRSMNSLRYQFDQHVASVKAIDWCPYQSNLLASGGGCADRHIRFWNITNGNCINEIDTKSQVCAIKWSKNYPGELISSHGFSQNQLTVWQYPTMSKVIDLTGHKSRVLHMCVSPDGETVASAAADETLRFWKVFEKRNERNKTPLKKSIFANETMELR